MDQLKNVFVFDMGTYYDQKYAEANAAGLYDVNRLPEMWYRDLTPDAIETEKEYVIVSDISNGNPAMNIKYISDNYEGDERFNVD